jgi:hypothetical protein
MKPASFVPLLSCFISFVGGIAFAGGFGPEAAPREPEVAIVMCSPTPSEADSFVEAVFLERKP